MGTKDALAAALGYIEDNITERLTLTAVGAAAFTSPSHLRRLFLMTTGQPLMTYVRMRRLSRSLDALLDTDMRVVDIAHEFGFSSEQAYIRAFQGAFGVSPGSLRRTRRIVAVCQPIDVGQLRPAGDGVLYGPEIVKVPSFHVVGRLHRISERDNLDQKAARVALDFFDNDRSAIGNAIQPPVYVGLTRYPPGATDWSNYLASVEVAAAGPVTTENWGRICEAGVSHLVTPIDAEAHALPYADGFFDASVCINSFQFYGTSDTYLEDHFARLVKPGGIMAFALPGLREEFSEGVPPDLKTFSSWENLNWFHTAQWWRRNFTRSRQCSRITIDDFAGDGVRLMTQWARIMDKSPAEIEDAEQHFVWLRLLAERKEDDHAE